MNRIGIAAVMVVAALLSACGGKEAAEAKAEGSKAPTRTVATVRSVTAQWPDVYEAVGTVRARTASAIASQMMGHVREVTVQVGDRVTAGQTLVRLATDALDAGSAQAEAALNEARSAEPEVASAVAAAQAEVDLAQATYKRMSDLFAKRSISNQEFDEAAAKQKMAQANLAMARARQTQLTSKIAQAEQGVRAARVQSGYAVITAPFAGVVTEKRVEPGMVASPGMPLLTIEQAGALRLEAAVEEAQRSRIRVGLAVEVRLDGLDRTIAARVSEIVPSVDPGSRTFIAKIDLPAVANLSSGAFGRAGFVFGQRSVLAVPAAAVMERGQLQMVFTPMDGVARARLVTLGARREDAVEVLSGLSDGEGVISPAPAGLNDGDRIEVRQ